MASVTVKIDFADGDSVTAHVEAKTSYPQALAEAKAVALEAWREAVAFTIAAQTDADQGSE